VVQSDLFYSILHTSIPPVHLHGVMLNYATGMFSWHDTLLSTGKTLLFTILVFVCTYWVKPQKSPLE